LQFSFLGAQETIYAELPLPPFRPVAPFPWVLGKRTKRPLLLLCWVHACPGQMLKAAWSFQLTAPAPRGPLHCACALRRGRICACGHQPGPSVAGGGEGQGATTYQGSCGGGRGREGTPAGDWRSKSGGQRQGLVLGLPPSAGYVFCTEPGPCGPSAPRLSPSCPTACLLAFPSLGTALVTLHVLDARRTLLWFTDSKIHTFPPHINVSEIRLCLTIAGIL